MVKGHHVIIVEGPISAGKTVLVKELGDALKKLFPQTLVMLEPDEKDGANPYLAMYYEDPKRWAFTMQVHLLTLRYAMHERAQWHAMTGAGPALLDRSFQGDTCFEALQRDREFISEFEDHTYRRLYHEMTAKVLKPSICIRLLTSPEVCAERIQKRMITETGRSCEDAVDLDYLRDLDAQIDRMTSVLRQDGTTVWEVPWDPDRDTPETRAQTVHGLACRIRDKPVRDMFPDLHRRSVG